MLLTVDTSAVLSVLLNEPSRGHVLDITRGRTLIAPASLDWEVGNALSAMFKQKRLSLEQAERALADFALMRVERRPVSLLHAVQLASKLEIYAYDAYMLAAAGQYTCPLLSLDRGLKEAARRAGIELLEATP